MVRVSMSIKQQIVELYPTHTQKELARKFNVSPWKVMTVLQEAGATKNNKLTAEIRDRITRAYDSGEVLGEISRRFNLDRSYIIKIARDGGAKPRNIRPSSRFYPAYVDSGLVEYWGA